MGIQPLHDTKRITEMSSERGEIDLAEVKKQVSAVYLEPLQKPTLAQTCVRFANPVYHYKKLKEDIAAFKTAFKNRNKPVDGNFAGPTNILALVGGYAAQRYFDNVYVGLFATILLGILITTSAYQALWWTSTKTMYTGRKVGFWDHFNAVQRDLWPVHFHGIRVALTLLLITAPIHTGGVAVFHTLAPKLANVFPAAVVLFVVDIIFIQGPFLRSMGDCFERQARVLADRYFGERNTASA
jgi:hypothetical protein